MNRNSTSHSKDLFYNTAVRVIEYFKMVLRAKRCLMNDHHGVISYLKTSVKPGQTIIDIGSNQQEYLHFLLNTLKNSGKLVIFETTESKVDYFLRLLQLFKWRHVVVETLPLSDISVTKINYITKYRNPTPGNQFTMDLEYRSTFGFTTLARLETLDDYCKAHSLQPAFIKIDAMNALDILYGTIETLTTYKPKVLIRCEEKEVGKQQVIDTFNFLTGLSYRGYFVLDTIRLPLINFDFNVYQNLRNDFYCNYFMFE